MYEAQLLQIEDAAKDIKERMKGGRIYGVLVDELLDHNIDGMIVAAYWIGKLDGEKLGKMFTKVEK